MKLKDVLTLRPAPSTEFSRDLSCDNDMSWDASVCKVLPRCIIMHPETSTNTHARVLDFGHLGAGAAGGSGERSGVGWV